MNSRTFLIALAFLLLGLFAMLNWSAISTPTELSVGFAKVQAPLGLVMLMVTALVSGLFVLYIIVQQVGVIAEGRRYAKELKSQRELADKAEASRFTDLQNFVAGEFAQWRARHSDETAQTAAKLTGLAQQVVEKIDETARVLSAYIGEVDDKLDRALAPKST